MPSPLRLQTPFSPIAAVQITTTKASSPLSFAASPRPAKKQRTKMSISQTYQIASTARAKLGREACRPDHDLRVLVGHANLLDALTLELRDAEREQEAWFNASVQKAQAKEDSTPLRQPQHIRWADTIVEEAEDEDDSASDSDSDSDYDEEEFAFSRVELSRIRQAPVLISSAEVDAALQEEDEDMYEDDEDDDPELQLVRTSSHPAPPELVHDSDDSEDESPPASPPQLTMDFDEKSAATTIIDMSMGKRHPAVVMHRPGIVEPRLVEAY